MKRRAPSETPPLDLIEQAFHLLREARAGTLLCHLVGALPFVLGALYFWSDMARGVDAARHLPAAALGLTLQFFWLKIWQAIFAQQLFAQLRGQAGWIWTWTKLGRLATAQIVLQPAGLFVLPVAFVLAVPFGWVHAFFQNVTALGGEDDDPRGTARQAWRLMRLWPMQNHQILLVMFLFTGIVLLNIASAAMLLPFLVKMLFGVESAITRSPEAAFNSTFIAAAGALTWLCVDPFIKAVYVLRCFHGVARQTGADLLAGLRPLAGAARIVALLGLGAWCLLGSVSPAPAAEPVRPAPVPTIVPENLERAIGEVLQQREYTWRLPRENGLVPKEDQGWMSQFIDSVFEVIGGWLKKVTGWMDDLWRWIFKPPALQPGQGPALDWTSALKGLFVVLIAVCLGILAFFLYRLWQRRGQAARPGVMASAAPTPDLANEEVGAEQLPEDGWMRLGREMIAGGDLRLALRAFYLASLAHLAERNLIALARFKSNLDYARELQRRGHALPALVTQFGENVTAFERVWYGHHEASRDLVVAFSERVERMRSGA